MKRRVVIVGAGASGMMAGIIAARNNAEVIILEHQEKAGKKILQTGNGRCNLTNLYINQNCYLNQNNSEVMKLIDRFAPADTVDFFEDLGLMLKSRSGYTGARDEKYIYPNSDQALTVLNALLDELYMLGVHIEYEVKIQNIRPSKDGFTIEYICGGKNTEITAQSVILAAGSQASPKTGSDGSGYTLAKSLGHKIIRPLPALVPLETDAAFHNIAAGVRSEGVLTLYNEDGSRIAASNGEIQYTDYGISGIPVFQVSRYAVRSVAEHKKVYVTIDLLPQTTEAELADRLVKNIDKMGRYTVISVISKWMNGKLAAAVCKELGVNTKNTYMKDMSVKDCGRISHCIKCLSMNITGYKSFDKGQICSGGVSLEQIDMDTLESKILKGLYFSGEILDVDGICGGYNLQWAWSSGYIAGKSAAEHAFND